MLDRERVRWDLTLPEDVTVKRDSKLRTALSGVVLLALVAGPMMIKAKEQPPCDEVGPESSRAPATEVTAVSWNGETGQKAKEDNNRADSTGAQHGRYFPGRQAM